MESALRVNHASREVTLNDCALNLTRLEFDLLACLMASPRVVMTTEFLQREVWGSDWWGEDHQVEVHVSRLRRKLGESGDRPHFIRTVRGVGYRFEPNPDDGGDTTHPVSPDGFAYFIVTVDGTIAWASATVEGYLGWKPEELVGRSLETLTAASQSMDYQTRTGTVMHVSLRHSADHQIASRMIVRPIKTHAVVQSFLIELVGDRALADTSPDVVLPIITSTHRRSVEMGYDRNLILTSLSPRDEPFLGWHPDDILGTFFLLTSVPELLDDQVRACALAQSMVDNGLCKIHDRMLARSATGELVPVHVHGEFLADADGRFAGLHASVTRD